MGRDRQQNTFTQTQVSTLPATGVYLQQLLFVIRAADFTITTDQAMTKVFSGTNWKVTLITANRKSGAYGVACLGGVYTAASKGGNAVVAATQTWAGLSGAGKTADATLAAIVGTDVQSSAAAYFALSTGNTGALTADVFVFGICMD